MLTNLFEGYKAASYSFLSNYISIKQETYEYGHELTPIALMLLADNKFQI